MNKLNEKNYKHVSNQVYLNDVEIDCIYTDENNIIHIVETKMFKLNTYKRKLKNKIKKHYGKLSKDIEKLSELKEFKDKKIEPKLLVNVTDDSFLLEVCNELRKANKNLEIQVVNLNMLFPQEH